MTKKRFRLGIEENGTPRLFDNETNCWYPIKDNEQNVKILINRLNDLDTFRKGYFDLQKQIKQLREENHRLRLVNIHADDLHRDVEWLKENLGRSD